MSTDFVTVIGVIRSVIGEDKTISVDGKVDMMHSRYCRSKTEDMDMYNQLCQKYEFYNTVERISQCKYDFDTQITEGVNMCISKYTPNSEHHSKHISLQARVKTTAGVHNCGNHHFWTEMTTLLDVDVPLIPRGAPVRT